ncbi:hypothetical protein ACLF3G_20500 [Falsiroseomonas sp. HC035]|uniref:hypothetical protein n=1 Tax=Falsiroseomonas sp. HC035 TaxID=3390999 RepID=UPI003D31961B
MPLNFVFSTPSTPPSPVPADADMHRYDYAWMEVRALDSPRFRALRRVSPAVALAVVSLHNRRLHEPGCTFDDDEEILTEAAGVSDLLLWVEEIAPLLWGRRFLLRDDAGRIHLDWQGDALAAAWGVCLSNQRRTNPARAARNAYRAARYGGGTPPLGTPDRQPKSQEPPQILQQKPPTTRCSSSVIVEAGTNPSVTESSQIRSEPQFEKVSNLRRPMRDLEDQEHDPDFLARKRAADAAAWEGRLDAHLRDEEAQEEADEATRDVAGAPSLTVILAAVADMSRRANPPEPAGEEPQPLRPHLASQPPAQLPAPPEDSRAAYVKACKAHIWPVKDQDHGATWAAWEAAVAKVGSASRLLRLHELNQPTLHDLRVAKKPCPGLLLWLSSEQWRKVREPIVLVPPLERAVEMYRKKRNENWPHVRAASLARALLTYESDKRDLDRRVGEPDREPLP